MRLFTCILFLLFLATSGYAQSGQPDLLGTVTWKLAEPKAIPELLNFKEHRSAFTPSIVPDKGPDLFKKKISPESALLKKNFTNPVSLPLQCKGQPIIPYSVEDAPGMLSRDNQKHSISYTDKQHGFIAKSTSSITEDKDHNIWMATDAGLVKYDGYHYSLYNLKSGLTSNGMNVIAYDTYGRLWYGTEKGVFYIKNDSLFSLRSGALDLSLVNCVNIQLDRFQRIWICTKENGALLVDGNLLQIFDQSAGLPTNYVFTAMVDKNNNYVFGLWNRGLVFIRANEVISFFSTTKQISSNIITSLYEDATGLWIGGFTSGLIHMSPTDTITYSFSGRYNQRIYDIKQAPNGGMWLSIYGKGVYYFNGKEYFPINSDNGLRSNYPLLLFQDSFQNLWISDLADGVSRLNENCLYMSPYENPVMKAIGYSAKDMSGGTWLFSNGAGLLYHKDHQVISYLLADKKKAEDFLFPANGTVASDGTVWMGSYGVGPVKISGQHFINYEFSDFPEDQVVTSAKEDQDHQIWFGTLFNGILKYQGNHLYHYTTKNGLLENQVLQLYADNRNNIYTAFRSGFQRVYQNKIETLYIGEKKNSLKVNDFISLDTTRILLGTEYNGLILLLNNKAYQFTKKTGLLSDNIHAVTRAADGKIWISSDKGIEYIVLNGTRIIRHSLFNQSSASYLNTVDKSLLNENGEPYWPMPENKMIFNPVFQTNKNIKPFFTIQKILVDHALQKEGAAISILPNQTIDIDYTIKYWGRENNLNISYLLKSVRGDSSIHKVDNKGHIVISDIVPGSYQIILDASDNNKHFYTEPILLEVKNYWYNTWLFRIALAIITLSGIISYFRNKSMRQQISNELLKKKVAEQTAEIQAEKIELEKSYKVIGHQNQEKDILIQEINHRVKNNLQFMTAMIEMQIKNQESSETKESIQEIFRRITAMSLVHEMLYDNRDTQGVSLQKYVMELIEHLKEMMVNELNPIHFDASVTDIIINSKIALPLGMIISELVSNSLKHAFHNMADPKVSILIEPVEGTDQLFVRISDNGRGIPKNKNIEPGLGSRLVDIFSRQLEGTYTIDSKDHFVYKLFFNPIREDV